jgi:hypothetical protein
MKCLLAVLAWTGGGEGDVDYYETEEGDAA